MAFFVLWCGQFLSVVGTRMTNFALSVWVWDATGSTTQFTLMLFFAFAGTVLFSPVAGSFIDRWNRKLTLVLADVGSAVMTALTLVLFLAGPVTMWQLYLINFVTGAFVAFQVPVLQATITIMMQRGNYTRANAMMFALRSGPELFAPLVAALMLAMLSIETILLVDALSCLFAIGAVLLVAVPATPRRPDVEPFRFWQDCLVGFKYILRSRSLRNFEMFLVAMNVLASVGYLLLRPLVLARTGNSVNSLALVLSTGAIGGVAGVVLLAALTNPKDKLKRVLWGTVVFSVVGRVLYGVSDMVLFLGVALIVVHLCLPMIDGYANTVWQEKVEPHVQGRVFAARQFVEDLSIPIATLIAGPLIEDVFTPWMEPGQPGAALFGGMVGTGQAGGIGLMFVLIGVLGTVMAAAAFMMPSIRRMETLLPDQASEEPDTAPEPAPEAEPEAGIPAETGAKS
jgi:MFS transporter, DHA3 family, macrolide efflux protein